ncbi:HAD-IA family hydrolase [Actinopolymorpha pittospori]|uniref:HAD superfamily hydrolase (TIGR01509 family) n=1 Tax=Actinopolymorpha pittospori TaxID=648752 RepID=A0A927MXY4_9ACTN|nr:HAD-IA family hydrolase [Actinopolymorpha pittospori]MBE1608975.1 HAD superfamily hydrolase (TIGR01509 family) [Actinopolymorpha pittospori]
MPALIFDCDGVLADTERDGHRPAFNATFAEVGIPVCWSVEAYAEKLRVGGGKERMATLLTPDFVERWGLPIDTAGQRELLQDWHQRKTARYTELIRDGRIPARPGVARVASEALAAGWQVAVASTSAASSVRAVLEHAVGAMADRFSIFAGDAVARKKPAPDIYRLALDRLGVEAREAVVIEDSHQGLTAARGAGLSTVVTVSGYTAEEDFTDASLVLTSLGGDDEPARVIADPLGIDPGSRIHLDDLRAVMELAPADREEPA